MAVVIAYVVVLQGLAGSYARASTISPAENPFNVICASSGIVDTAPDSKNTPLKKSAECPCALLCRLAGSAVPAILAGFAPDIDRIAVADKPTARMVDMVAPSSQRRLLAEPRAPPRGA